jgi:hypothetical protein
MKNDLRNLINEFHYHEALDRTSMLISIIDSHLIQHPICKVERLFSEKIELAVSLLAEAYQTIACSSFNKNV